MMIPDLVLSSRTVADHLWQSTLVACVAAALVWLLRKGEARLRHAIWLAASIKFLVPFAVLVNLGQHLTSQRSFAASEDSIVTTVIQIGQPFASSGLRHSVAQVQPQIAVPWLLLLSVLWAAGCVAVLIAWTARWRRVLLIARSATPQHAGREVDLLRAAERAAGVGRPIPLLVSKGSMEPGIFGIVHPVLLWPEGISAHLDDEQLAAIVTHEVCHVRRRDNLLALLHMCVQAIFWFHPLVWWMGTRLMEERERACDEAVLRLGNEPSQYADAILKACRYSIESPLTCVSGVSGSNLKRRMVQIMNAATIPLSRSRKMLLATVAVAAIALPISMGVLHPRVVKADEAQDPKYASLRFDTATLTPAQSAEKTFFVVQNDGEFIHNSITMKDLIAMAYGVRPDRIIGGPDWTSTQHFNFEAHWAPTHTDRVKISDPDKIHMEQNISIASAGSGGRGHSLEISHMLVPATVQAMLRNFLAERTALKIRDDSEVLPVYELVVANGGSKLSPTHEEQPSSGEAQVKMKTRFEVRAEGENQFYSITNGDARMLCENLSRNMGHEVVDKTGLTGRYDFKISFPAHADADQIASTLRDQLGLDLQSTQQPVKVLAVDHVDMPQSR